MRYDPIRYKIVKRNEIERVILRTLQKNGDMNCKELNEFTPCAYVNTIRKIRNLEKEGLVNLKRFKNSVGKSIRVRLSK